MGNAQKISAWWKNYTVVVSDINNPDIAWETIAKEVYQLTPEVPATETEAAVPATYRVTVYPINRNNPGADEPIVEVGFKFMDFIGQVYEIIAVSEDKSTIDVADILLCGYCPPSGRPAMIYKESGEGAIVIPPGQTYESRWTVVTKTCLLDENMNNTGQQEVVTKKQIYDEDSETWKDTGETTKTTVTNHTDCPPPAPDPYRMAQWVGQTWDAENAVNIPFSTSKITVNSLAVPGDNYIFFSTPTALGKPEILNSLNKDISYQFTSAGTDNKVGYQPNTIWKRNSTFGTTLKVTFYITV